MYLHSKIYIIMNELWNPKMVPSRNMNLIKVFDPAYVVSGRHQNIIFLFSPTKKHSTFK